VSLKSVSGVDSVEVSLAKGLASVKMKPGNTATLKQLQDAISKNGFTMKPSAATIAGKVVVANGKVGLQISGSNEMLWLVPESQSVPDAVLMDGKTVVVEGTIPEAGKGKAPDSIRYRSMVSQ
jgi:copper chaperone CopZ